MGEVSYCVNVVLGKAGLIWPTDLSFPACSQFISRFMQSNYAVHSVECTMARGEDSLFRVVRENGGELRGD